MFLLLIRAYLSAARNMRKSFKVFIVEFILEYISNIGKFADREKKKKRIL